MCQAQAFDFRLAGRLSLKNAVLAALEFGWWAVTLPLRLLAPPAGESATPEPALCDAVEAEREIAADLLDATQRGMPSEHLGDRQGLLRSGPLPAPPASRPTTCRWAPRPG